MTHDWLVGIFRQAVEWCAIGVDIVAIAVIVVAVISLVTWHKPFRTLYRLSEPGVYDEYKHRLGKPLLLGMDLLVAADVIKTVALEPDLAHVEALGLLVLIRTFLSWCLFIEMFKHFPWRVKEK